MSSIPPDASSQSTLTIETMRQSVAATLAAAIITSAGRPHSIAEALNVWRDVQFAIYPAHGNSRYREWKEKANLEAVHK